MAHSTPIDGSPRVLPVDLAAQVRPGTFEHAAHHLDGSTTVLPARVTL